MISPAPSQANEPNPRNAPAEQCHLAPVTQAHLTRHVMVCQGKSCSANGSEATLEAFWEALREKERLYGKRGSLTGDIIVGSCGSVGLCKVGPAVLVYPDGVWYAGVTPEHVPQIVQEHLIDGHPVEALKALSIPSPSPVAANPENQSEGSLKG